MSATTPLSKNVLVEVLRQFVITDALPSERALKELADSAGESIQSVKNYYTMAYESAGNEGNPWGPVAPILPDRG